MSGNSPGKGNRGGRGRGGGRAPAPGSGSQQGRRNGGHAQDHAGGRGSQRESRSRRDRLQQLALERRTQPDSGRPDEQDKETLEQENRRLREQLEQSQARTDVRSGHVARTPRNDAPHSHRADTSRGRPDSDTSRARRHGTARHGSARHRRRRSRDREDDDASIEPQPRNLRDVTSTIVRMKTHMSKLEWNKFLADVRHYLQAACLDWNLTLKRQDKRRLAKVFNAIEEKWPQLRRFQNSWATEFMVKQAYAGRRSYASAIDQENSYRSRRRRELQARHRLEDSPPAESPSPRRTSPSPTLDLDAYDTNEDGLQSPGAGPSRPSRLRHRVFDEPDEDDEGAEDDMDIDYDNLPPS